MNKQKSLVLLLSLAVIGNAEGKASQQLDDSTKERLKYVDFLLAKGKPQEAVSLVTSMLKELPKDEKLLLVRAEVYRKQNRLDEAIADYTRILSQSPGNQEVWKLRGDCFKGRNNLSRAMADINKAIELDPMDHQALYSRASVRHSSGDLEGALKDCQSSIAIKSSANALFTMGSMLINLGRIKEAQDAYTRVLSLDQRYWRANQLRAQCDYILGQYDKAISDYTVAIISRPRVWRLYLMRAQAYLESGQPHKASVDLEKATHYEPAYAQLVYSQSTERVLHKAGAKPGLQPGLPETEYERLINESLLLYKRRQYAEACKILTSATQMKKSDQFPIVLRARILLEQGKFDEALGVLDACDHIWNSKASDYIGHLRIAGLIGKKHYKAALSGTNAALFWDKYWRAGYYYRAIALDALNRPHNEVIENFRRYLSLDSSASRTLLLSDEEEKSPEWEKIARGKIQQFEQFEHKEQAKASSTVE